MGPAVAVGRVPRAGRAGAGRPRRQRGRHHPAADAAFRGALGWSLMYGVGRAREAGPAWATTLDLAERLDDTGYRLRALWSLCIDQFNNGDLRTALEFARRFAGLAAETSDAIALTIADRLLATAQHYF